MNIDSRFEKIDRIPERQRIAETFGWQPGIWGVMFIVAAWVSLPYVNSSSPDESWLVFGCLAVLGLSLTGYEIRRRRNRTVLVKDDNSILVFRKGRLDLILEPEKIIRIKADFHTMLYVGVCLFIAAAIFLGVGIINMAGDQMWQDDDLLILFVGLGILASLVSAAWTRFYCCHLRIPIGRSKWTEESVLIRSARLKELFT